MGGLWQDEGFIISFPFEGSGALQVLTQAGCLVVLGPFRWYFCGGTWPGGALASWVSGRSLVRGQSGSWVYYVSLVQGLRSPSTVA